MSAGTTRVADGNAEMAAAWDGPEGEHWAANASRYEGTGVAFGERLFAAPELHEGSRVLDVGCGTGALTLRVGRVTTAGAVLGVDLSSPMLEVGRARAAREHLDHVRFQHADAQVYPFDEASFDVAMSNCGVMFFADPVAAFANIRRALRPRGTIAWLAWRDLARNEWVCALREALAAGRHLPVPPPGVPGPFSLADRDLTHERLTAAGFTDVQLESVDEPVSFGRDADDAYAFVSTLGLARGLTADLDDATRNAAFEQLHRSLAEHETEAGVVFAGSAWLITAGREPAT
jgi:SAM-dependent methyltransferase